MKIRYSPREGQGSLVTYPGLVATTLLNVDFSHLPHFLRKCDVEVATPSI